MWCIGTCFFKASEFIFPVEEKCSGNQQSSPPNLRVSYKLSIRFWEWIWGYSMNLTTICRAIEYCICVSLTTIISNLDAPKFVSSMGNLLHSSAFLMKSACPDLCLSRLLVYRRPAKNRPKYSTISLVQDGISRLLGWCVIYFGVLNHILWRNDINVI